MITIKQVRENWVLITVFVLIIGSTAKAELTLKNHGDDIDSMKKRDVIVQEMQQSIAVMNNQRANDARRFDEFKQQQDRMFELLLKRLPQNKNPD